MEVRMAEKHYEVRELKLGPSFTNSKAATQYHTIKYDFKPASVDVNKMASVDVGMNNQVTVTVPHLDGAGVPQTVFKGNQRPYTKECVLIIDPVTHEITLEKLSSNIQVKKTRSECNKPRPLTPVTAEFTNTTQRSSSRTRVATNRRANTNTGPNAAQMTNQSRFNGNAPLQKTPPTMVRSPQRMKTSPPQAAPWSGGNSTLASLPMIGLEDMGPAAPAPAAPAPAAPTVPGPGPTLNGGAGHHGYGRAPPAPAPAPYPPPAPPAPPAHPVHPAHPAPPSHSLPSMHREEDSSSSSSSGSGSDSGSDSDDDPPQHSAGTGGANPRLPTDVLKNDLCLSESGSDSD